MVRTMIVLANSWKHEPARCVAGRRIIDEGNQYKIGKWIRPVGTVDEEGALTPAEMTLDTGHPVSVWDFVEVSFSGNPGNPAQPENRTVDGGTWRSLQGRYENPSLALLKEDPESLWLEPDMRTDRVSQNYLANNPPEQSLYCIRPDFAQLRFSHYDGKTRKRVVFSYRDVDYDFSLTDPTAVRHHCAKGIAYGEPAVEVDLDPARVLLCVSLAGVLNGYHYKLVATVLTAQ